jgi:hypothetical protein
MCQQKQAAQITSTFANEKFANKHLRWAAEQLPSAT